MSSLDNKTLLKLFLGSVMGGYGYNPYELRSPIPKEVAFDVDKYGLTVKIDTVRYYLNEAKLLLPPPAWYEAVTGRKVDMK
jgi:hypothetical protein